VSAEVAPEPIVVVHEDQARVYLHGALITMLIWLAFVAATLKHDSENAQAQKGLCIFFNAPGMDAILHLS